MDHLIAARLTRDPLVRLGGAFMTSPQMSDEESRVGLPDRSLYFRGRSAVLGDPPPVVVSSLFGIFPDWLVELMLDKVTSMVTAASAIDAYTRGCAAWGADELAGAGGAGELAELLYRIVDGADLTALPLAAGWRSQERPEQPAERLAHALMLAREVRGGVHFAALRACGLSIPEAVVADPRGGRSRLQRTGWRSEDIEALTTRTEARPDLRSRWQRAQALTDETFAAAIKVLDNSEAARMAELLTTLTPTAAAPTTSAAR